MEPEKISSTPAVSAIVSIYDAGQDIAGCLNSLINQTLFKSNRLEIILIDAASPGGEKQLIDPFLKKYPHQFIYWQSPVRINLYEAWNKGAQIARGPHLTNANTDDRHEENCLERLCKALEQDSSLSMVYGHQKLTSERTFSFNDVSARAFSISPRFFAPSCLIAHPCGCHPMWKKSVHVDVGGFDESFSIIGDYDFTLRVAHEGKIKRIDDAWSLFTQRDHALSSQNRELEYQELRNRYFTQDTIHRLYEREGWTMASSEQLQRVYRDLFIRSLAYYHIWEGNWIRRSNYQLSHKVLDLYGTVKMDDWVRNARELLQVVEQGISCPNDQIRLWLEQQLRQQDFGAFEQVFPLPKTEYSKSRESIKFESLSTHLQTEALIDPWWGLHMNQIEEALQHAGSQRPLALAGRGELAGKMIPFLRLKGIEPSYIVDRNPFWAGKHYKGIPIIGWETLQIHQEAPYFIAGSWDRTGIERKLQRLGLKSMIDYHLPCPISAYE